jgi:GT2 family glycosyltransferase
MIDGTAAAPEISIVTATYNRLELTRAFVASVEATLSGLRGRYELVIVDDASTDGTREYLASLAGPVTILLNDRNRGYAYSNNLGAAAARGEFLFLLNNDVVLSRGWIDPMLDKLRSDPLAGAVGNIQFNPRTGLIDHAGVFFTREGLPRHARKNRRRPPAGDVREWPAVTAACLGIRRELFQRLGGFDEAYVNGFEDIDLCMKLKQAGYGNWVCNKSVIHHHVSSSPGRHVYNERNTRTFIARWRDTTIPIGRQQWPEEYLQRYARHWWRCDASLALQAVALIACRRARALVRLHDRIDAGRTAGSSVRANDNG